MGILTVLFRTRHDAEEGVAWLRERGYRDEEISVVMHGGSVPVIAGTLVGANAPEEQAMRSALPLMGTAAGISVAAVVAGIALTVGVEGLLAAGPLALLLAAVGAVSAGGIVGILEGAGIPDDDAERYADELKRGGVLVSVAPHPENEDAVRSFFARFG